MSSWDIDPAGVSTVLSKIGGVLGDGSGEGLSGATSSGFDSLADAVSASGSGVVGTALNEFIEYASAQSQAMVAKTVKATVGCSEAVQAYMDGDLEMAERAQSRVDGTSVTDL